ncbi:hypothetical protein ACHAXM_008232 [Skeletonema potamos]
MSSAAAAASAAKVPPLSLTTVKARYPNLYRTFSYLSSRELESNDNCNVARSPVDAATGLATTIMFVDFTQPLGDNAGSPMNSESDANKFCIFLWKMLDASESGSIGGDACRFFDALYAAYKDIMTMNSTAAKFGHLLGWVIAVVNHGIGALLERGDPDRNRILFKNVAEELKKIFKQDTAALGIENNLRDFAITWCGHMQKMLKSVKKEYGEYAENYSFNYLYKPRPKKADSAAASSVAVAAAAAVSLGVDVAMTTEGKAANQADDLSPTSVAHVPGVKGGTGRPKVDEDGDDEPKPWEEEGWVPRTKAGKQKSPNVIRGELQRYIDKCKADGTMTQTKIIEKMGNGTYWAGARLHEEARHEEEKARKAGGSSAKRKAAATGEAPTSKKSKKDQATELIERINAVEGVSDDSPIFDTCPVVVANIKAFLQRDGITKAILLKALGDINSNSLNRFLTGKQQDQCGNVTYKRAYVFFEKLRIMEGKPKSSKRLSSEAENPRGFSTEKARSHVWVFAKHLL